MTTKIMPEFAASDNPGRYFFTSTADRATTGRAR